MIASFWNLSAAIRGYFRHYMPTNRAIDWLRTPRGLKVALPVAALAALAYLLAMVRHVDDQRVVGKIVAAKCFYYFANHPQTLIKVQLKLYIISL